MLTSLRTLVMTAGLVVVAVSPVFADDVMRIPASGGEVVLPTDRDKRAYDVYHYAAARRAGDLLFISGVVVGRLPNEGTDVESFKAQVRRALTRIGTTLAAAGANFGDVVMINSFHVWSSPNFAGDRAAQFAAVGAVKDEFIKAPYPAWTAVGTTDLIADGGIVEIQVIANVAGTSRGRHER